MEKAAKTYLGFCVSAVSNPQTGRFEPSSAGVKEKGSPMPLPRRRPNQTHIVIHGMPNYNTIGNLPVCKVLETHFCKFLCSVSCPAICLLRMSSTYPCQQCRHCLRNGKTTTAHPAQNIAAGMRAAGPAVQSARRKKNNQAFTSSLFPAPGTWGS